MRAGNSGGTRLTSSEADFATQLEVGRKFEHLVFDWLQSQGYHVVPTFDFAGNGAPKMYGLEGQTTIPDLLVFGEFPFFIECKAKSRIVTRWNNGPDCTGFDLKHHRHYRKVQHVTKIPVFVIFDNNGVWFGNWIDTLAKNQHPKLLLTRSDNKEIVLFPISCLTPMQRPSVFSRPKGGIIK